MYRCPFSSAFVVGILGVLFASLPLRADEIIHSVTPLPPVAGLSERAQHAIEAKVYKALNTVLQGDRLEYWNDDRNGQFFLLLPRRTGDTPASITIALEGEGGKKIASLATPPLATNRLSFLISTSGLAPGKYTVSASCAGDAAVAEYGFVRSNKSYPAVAIPADGIPIALEDQSFVPNMTWPIKTGVPLPQGALNDVSRLALFEDGKPIPAGVRQIATWGPGGSARWIHLDFLGKYAQGKPAQYRLKVLPQAAPAMTSPLHVDQTDERITVDTGAIRFIVNRKQFRGVDQAWLDPSGTGKYDEAKPVVQGSQGPFLVDGRLIRFEAALDKNAQVAVEQQTPVSVTILAKGWYASEEGRVPPLCQFVTRIHAYAGQPLVRISHHTIITYDTRPGRLAQLGFHIGVPGAEMLRLGADGATREAALPAAPATAFLHQDRYDHFRLVGLGKDAIEGKQSDGWFSLQNSGGAAVSLMLRDIWQKFPKEVETDRAGMTVNFWPRHGRRAFAAEDELKIENIYKWWCFHQGALLNLDLPTAYYEALAGPYAEETMEARPEHALNGNGQGLAIGNEFALDFAPAGQAAGVPKLAALYQYDPTALSTPEWNGATLALGKMAAQDNKNFPAMEQAIHEGYLSWMKNFERGQEYGMWNYCDSHTYWDVERNRANLHRVWHNSHYHEMGMTWLNYFRTASPRLLRWARPSTDHFMNVGTCNYSERDANGRRTFMFHEAGAQYHCKGLTPWGAEAYGMVRRDDHAGVSGHWIDPDAFLWDWYLTGNERAKDVYDMWAAAYSSGPMYVGVRRETNTTLAYMLSLYEHNHDATLLPAIRTTALSLRTREPLENQNPGPLWHSLWINRYYDQMRDPEYVPFILKYARMPGLGNTWTTALAALAYELSGDKTYLAQHLDAVANFPRKMFHAPGNDYDWSCVGPGPLGSNWGAYFNWGHFLYALHQAGITSAPQATTAHGGYPVRPSPFSALTLPASFTVYALKAKGVPLTVHYAFDTNHPASSQLFDPAGEDVHTYTRIDASIGKPAPETIAADAAAGLYELQVRVHWMVAPLHQTDASVEAAVVPTDDYMQFYSTRCYVQPQDGAQAYDVTVRSTADASPTDFIVQDATGQTIAKGNLFKPVKGFDSASFKLDPARHKLPWVVDVMGNGVSTWSFKSAAKVPLLVAASPESLKVIGSELNKK